MIYLEVKYDLVPATPAQLDALVALFQQRLVDEHARLGARLMAAWTSSVVEFCRVTHLFELDDLAAWARFREQAKTDPDFQAGMRALDDIAPLRQEQLLEPISDAWPALFRGAAESSRKNPRKGYSLAMLQVLPGRMDVITGPILDGPGQNPIVVSLKAITGPNDVLMDIWAMDLYPDGYQSGLMDFMKDFFIKVRQSAPRERLEPVRTLPYSPLQ